MEMEMAATVEPCWCLEQVCSCAGKLLNRDADRGTSGKYNRTIVRKQMHLIFGFAVA